MQYMCGLSEFTDKPIFDPSLFVTIRKRISEEGLYKMTTRLLTAIYDLYGQQRKMFDENLNLAEVYHCENIDKVTDEIISKYGITKRVLLRKVIVNLHLLVESAHPI